MTLGDYLSPQTLQKLQDAFTAASEFPIRICGPDGQPLTEPSDVPRDPVPAEESAPALEHAADAVSALARQAARVIDPAASPTAVREVPVLIGSEVAGRVMYVSGEGPDSAWAAPSEHGVNMLRLLANVLGRLCDRERELRTRVDELVTVYHVTSEFAAQRDLQSLLDLVTDTVVNVLRAKACAIRLLSDDHKELVIKAVANLSPEYLDKGVILVSENPVDREVLTSLRPVYVRDQGHDPRVTFPQEAQREGIVSALCAPLVYRGHPEGVLRVYMGQVHAFDWFEVSLIQAIAAQAAAAIVNTRLAAEAVRAGNIQRQLRLAAEVQQRMIPAQPPRFEGFDLGALYVPCFELGGDFYDFIDLPPGNLGLAVCDVAGKGLRASLLMASIRASLRAHAVNVYDTPFAF